MEQLVETDEAAEADEAAEYSPPASLDTNEADEGLSPFGRAALGLAIGAVLWRGLEMPGGLFIGGLAGAVVGYYLPMPKGGSRG